MGVLTVLAACAPTPAPTQPDFAPSPTVVTPEEAPTEITTTGSLSADFGSVRRTFDPAKLLGASQGGYEPMSNLYWFGGQTAQLSSIGISTVRLDHVLSNNFWDIVNMDASGGITYDFSKIDKVTLPLVDAGIVPFIVLAYNPTAAPDPLWSPSSLAVWSDAVEALVQHYRDLGHSGWGYEVWNEVDTGSWKGTLADYATVYAASAQAVRSADPTAEVGGAAASDLRSPGGWSTGFIDYLAANPTVPADFFSVHSYRTDGWGSVADARALLDAAGRPGLPIYITEWNNDSFMDKGPGTGSDTNSSVNGSSYVAKRLAAAIDSGAEKFFYFSPVEGFSHTKTYNGDLGLVTVDGHRKSLANVFQMYSQLEPNLIFTEIAGPGSETGDVTGIVTSDENSGTVLLWNNTANNSLMSVALAGLPFAGSNYRVSETVVSATKGNGFADSSTEVEPVYPSPNENAPVVTDEVVDPSTTFARDIAVPAHGVVSVRLSATSLAVGPVDRSAEPAAINLAATASGSTATATSSVEAPVEGWALANLTDGRRHSFERSDPIHGWSSLAHPTADAKESVTLDLGEITPVDTAVLWPRDSQQFDGTGFPEDFSIDASTDGKKWRVVYTAEGYNGTDSVAGAQTIGFKPTELRYLRLTATKLSKVDAIEPGSFALQLGEIEAYRLGLSNGGFETGKVTGWKATGSAETQSTVVRGGRFGLVLSDTDSAISRTVVGLKPSTTYTFGAHAKLDSSGGSASLSASEFGGERVTSKFTSKAWSTGWVTFTTGADETTAVLDFTLDKGGLAWADDFVLTQDAESAD